MPSDYLYAELAKALSQPSKAYRTAQAGLAIPQQLLQGYLEGGQVADLIRKRKLEQSTLQEALGGNLPSSLAGFGNTSVEAAGALAKPIEAIAALEKASGASSMESVMTQEDALKAGKVPKGTRIITPQGESVTFIGNDADGTPLLMNKKGVISRGTVPGGSSILPKTSTMSTSSTRSSSEFAQTLLPHINHMRDLIDQADAKGYIGPASARVYGQFMAGKVGSTGNPDADNLLGELRATDSLIKTGAMRVHFGARGGEQMYDHFSDLLNSGKQSSAMLNGSLNGIQSFMEGYAAAGSPGGYKPPPPQKKMPTDNSNIDYSKLDDTELRRIAAGGE